MNQYKWVWLVMFLLSACNTETSTASSSNRVTNLICLGLLFLIGFLAINAFIRARFRSKSGDDFRKGKASLESLFDQYYRPGRPLTPDEQEAINSHRESLEEAINSFQSAREMELRGTAFGGGTFGKYTFPILPNELTTCPVCDTPDSFFKYQQLDHAHKIRCSTCQTAFNVDERRDRESGLAWIRVLAHESPDEVGQMSRKYIVIAKNKREAATALHEIGMVYRLLGDLDQAKSVFQQSYTETEELYSKFGRYSTSLANDLAVNSLHLGDIEHLSGNLEKAIEWYEKSKLLYEESGDETNLQLVRDVLNTVPKQ